MLGWPRAWEQHDVAEFHDFLVPRLTRATGDMWQGRAIVEDTMRIHQTGQVSKCISLPLPPAPKTEVQELIDAWHQQDDLCALVVTPPWLSLQLPRFNAETGAKTQQPYIVPGMLRLPVFAGSATQAVAWCQYEVCSIIRHHGPTFRAGHYTVLVRGDTDFMLDDDEQPKRVMPEDLDATSISMYVLVLCRCVPAGPDLNLAPPTAIPSSSHHGRNGMEWNGLDGSSGHHRERTLAVTSALPSGNLDKAAGERQ